MILINYILKYVSVGTMKIDRYIINTLLRLSVQKYKVQKKYIVILV